MNVRCIAGNDGRRLALGTVVSVVFLVFLLSGCASEEQALSDMQRREVVAQDVRESFLPADSSREVMTIYATLYPLATGIAISPAVNKDDPATPPPAYVLSKPSWFLVIDRDSLAGFAHDVTYIIAPDDGSPYEVHEEKWWPLIEGLNHWFQDGRMTAAREFIVYEGVVAADWRAAGEVFP